MRLDKIDLNLFVIFEAIYRERSVTKVAQSLNMTQSGVSNALRRLRETLGDPLFVRASDGMQPTPVAENVIVEARAGLASFSRVISTNARFDPAAAEKVFQLGMSDMAQLLVLPELGRLIKEQAPRVRISTYYIDRQAAAEDLKKGSMDLLIDAPDIHGRDLDQEPLIRLPYVVAMRKDHRLANRALSLDDYLAADHIHVSSRRYGRGQADVALRSMGKKRRIMMRGQSYSAAAAITAHSDLLWTVPRKMAETTNLQMADTPFTLDPLIWCVHWSRSASDDPSFLWLRGLISELISSQPANSL